ncbi:enoyl-CoA hydratase domain-containing protein 2, mitochondrial isoform X3 [Rhinolophus ferrumequinum]|uniref:Enoyl-CoA hydratase domain containing 2 n=1 Tax=Rhinolophus ferrumequinum TaxID=59479 RepID=A0A671DZ73_RHIFE|nr:enoyl-CoA hydratase domain-containing protein 2, mitochondrial isoform X3 [Rhinolophus ferrumequinum]
MQRALTSALRLTRPWRPLQACGYASHGTARDPEIQVRSLAGPDQGITEILMNRPRARNALGNVLVSELLEALAQLRADRQVRVLIFRSGVKGVFCAAAFPTPTIAAMDGFALGGGLELALACDLRVAGQPRKQSVSPDNHQHTWAGTLPSGSLAPAKVWRFEERREGMKKAIDRISTLLTWWLASSAVMGLIETTRGLLPGAGGTQRLPRCLGVALAKELIFTGRRLSGAQAQALGLVNHSVAQNEEGNAAYHRARELAQEILPQASIAVRLGKVAIDRGMEVDIASGMAIEGMCYAQNIPTRDRLEGMAAFREKRPPRFVGE